MVVSLSIFAVPVLVLPTLDKSRTFLGLQNDTDIELHLQHSASFFVAKLPPMIYLVSEAYGCLQSSDTVEICGVLSDCNFVVILYFALSTIFYFYLNHTLKIAMKRRISWILEASIPTRLLLSFGRELRCLFLTACLGCDRRTRSSLLIQEAAWTQATLP